MARPRTPSATLEIRGSFKKHPERRNARANEPEVNPDIGHAPAYFSGERRLCWQELLANSSPGVLSKSDRVALEMAACLLASMRADPSQFSSAKFARLQSLLASFGMTPSDRSKVMSGGGKKANKFSNNGKGK